MALKTRVKTANITNLSDARYCAGMGVDFLGFPVKSSTAPEDLKRYSDIRSWVAGPSIVLELNDQIEPSALSQAQRDNADFIQMNINDWQNSKESFLLPLIIKLDLNMWEASRPKLIGNRDEIAYLILSSEGALLNDFEQVKLICKDFKVLLTIKDADNDLAGILDLGVEGIELSGSHEEKPGLKGYDHLSDILEQLEE